MDTNCGTDRIFYLYLARDSNASLLSVRKHGDALSTLTSIEQEAERIESHRSQ